MAAKVIVIVGPTGSGKTELSLRIAEKIDCEIISADSRQLYKYIDIGTAKPSKFELDKVKHYFIDILKPDEDYNVSRFENDALKTIDNIIRKGKQPVVVGGSGLYIKAIVDGIFDSVDTDDDYREHLQKLREVHGNEYLYNELKKVDTESAAKMLPQNYKRIIRALEVYHLTGMPIGFHQKKYERETDFNFLQFGLDWDRKVLYDNINNRVDKMIEEGLIDEIKSLLNQGFDKNLNALNTVGYKEIISFLEGNISLEKAVELIKRNTRRFAKRQLTWFKRDERIIWFNINSKNDLNNISDSILQYL